MCLVNEFDIISNMLTNFWSKPLFWIGLYLIGYIITITILSLRGGSTKVENRMPKPFMRIFIFLTFIAPPVALPFTKGPKIAIPTPVALTIGIILLIINFIIKVLVQKRIGAEEKDLLEKYSEEYKEYKKKVRWKMIPKIV